MRNEWKYVSVVADGQPCKVDGLNIWDFAWEPTDEKVEIFDPDHVGRRTFDVYTITTTRQRIEFAATELSNCVWGFYARRTGGDDRE